MIDMGLYPDSDSSFTTCFFNNTHNKIQRRFTNQQIKSLETIFQTESKLEPRKKLQVAKDLGLQPRQVAIWFQNKRARWRTKQLERDYTKLRATFDSLSSRYDLLHKENQSLTRQLNKLREVIEKKGNSVEEKVCDYRSMKPAECVVEEDEKKIVSNVDNYCWDDLECDQVLDDDKWWD
ncbi:hypothetical protein R6Q57_027814, partial [Mikania cordata]